MLDLSKHNCTKSWSKLRVGQCTVCIASRGSCGLDSKFLRGYVKTWTVITLQKFQVDCTMHTRDNGYNYFLLSSLMAKFGAMVCSRDVTKTQPSEWSPRGSIETHKSWSWLDERPAEWPKFLGHSAGMTFCTQKPLNSNWLSSCWKEPVTPLHLNISLVPPVKTTSHSHLQSLYQSFRARFSSSKWSLMELHQELTEAMSEWNGTQRLSSNVPITPCVEPFCHTY